MKTGINKKNIIVLIAIIVVLVSLDQITKYLAVYYLTDNTINIINNFFKLELLYNSGAAFGILKNSRILFCIMTIVFCVALEYVYFKIPNEKKFNILKLDLIVLLSGAIGNLIDRIKSGQVVDFLSFKFGSYYFPTFNTADIYVTVAAILLFVLVVFYYSDSDFEKIFPSKDAKE